VSEDILILLLLVALILLARHRAHLLARRATSAPMPEEIPEHFNCRCISLPTLTQAAPAYEPTLPCDEEAPRGDSEAFPAFPSDPLTPPVTLVFEMTPLRLVRDDEGGDSPNN
jgi:hypothetical protein